MTEIAYFPRSEFLADRWHYRDGQHVTILGPNGWGKTQLAYQLLSETANPERQAVVLCMKPKDETVRDFSKAAGYKVIRQWPPMPSPWQSDKPPGYVLWPRHRFDPDLDNPVLRSEFRKALLDSYRRGHKIVFADEVYGLSEELNLDAELVTLWSRARAMKTGLWAASQRPASIPLWAYSEAEHLFLAKTPDKRARDRYDEIGGVDPGIVKAVTLRLKKFEYLYISRSGPSMCIIGP